MLLRVVVEGVNGSEGAGRAGEGEQGLRVLDQA